MFGVNGPRKDCEAMIINRASYDRKQQTLSITVDEEPYFYYNVPKFVFNQLVETSYKYEYFVSNIKNVYPCEKQKQ